MIFGIVVLAAGIDAVVGGHADGSPRIVWHLAGGLAVYFLGDVAFRATLGLRPLAPRLIGAGVAATLGFLGLMRGAAVELVALCLLAIATLALERFAFASSD